jgi:hypothetical protein
MWNEEKCPHCGNEMIDDRMESHIMGNFPIRVCPICDKLR